MDEYLGLKDSGNRSDDEQAKTEGFGGADDRRRRWLGIVRRRVTSSSPWNSTALWVPCGARLVKKFATTRDGAQRIGIHGKSAGLGLAL